MLPNRKWVTCEEVVRRSEVTQTKHGYVFEVDATADHAVEARPVTGAGRFAHEAVAWHRGILYLTEDRDIAGFGGSCFYRYVPEVEMTTRRSISIARSGGGAARLGQVWQYDPRRETITLIYESTSSATLEGPNNVVIVPQTGDIFLCEDAAAPQFIRGLTPEGAIYDFAMGINNNTEFAGACFDPDGHTHYVNHYGERGTLPFGPPGNLPNGPLAGGATYAIYGPSEQRDRRHRGSH